MAIKKKIAFICIYSAGGCGVWASVRKLAGRLSENYEVHVFSTDRVKDSKEKASSCENLNKIKIHRFSPKFSIGKNIALWSFYKKLKKINPDLIVAEVYRHPHTHSALKVARKLNKPIFLVTHAPFVEEELRGKLGSFVEKFYDKYLGKKILNLFDEIFIIAKWELPFLEKIGLKKKPIYLPNGIPDDFFKSEVISFRGKKILFVGRVSPVKNLEVLIKALAKLQNKNIQLQILGPADEKYGKKLKFLAEELKVSPQIIFEFKSYSLEDEILALKAADISVLPSKREGMPQTLVESLAAGKIVIVSNTKGSAELITDKKNGFIFENNNTDSLREKLEFCLNKKNMLKIKNLQIHARKSAEKFKLNNIVESFEKIVQKYLK